jgi:hypothetical protein
MSYILQALKKSEQERELAAQETSISASSKTENQANEAGLAAADVLASSSNDSKHERMIPLSVYMWLGGFVIILLAISGYVQMQLGASSNKVEPVAMNHVEVTPREVIALPVKEALTQEALGVQKTRPVAVENLPATSQKILIQEKPVQVPQQKPQIIRPTISAEQASDELQSMIPNIEVSSHIYSSLPGRRSIVVNGQRLIEADFINPQVQIKEITHQGMVIDVDGSPLKIDRSRGWSR